MEKLSVQQARQVDAVGKQATLQGWVRTRRDSKGGFSFIELNDGSCQGNVQIVAPGELSNYETEIKKLPTGASVSIEGEVKASPAKGQATEVHAKSVVIHGGADPEKYPLQKKGHTLRVPPHHRCAHLAAPNPTPFGAIARILQFRSANRFTISFRKEASSTFTPRSSRPAIVKGQGRCSEVTTLNLADVPRKEARAGRLCASISSTSLPT